MTAAANTLHAVTHCVKRLTVTPSEESAAVVAMPGAESVGKTMRPDDVETSCPAGRVIVLACNTSPAFIG